MILYMLWFEKQIFVFVILDSLEFLFVFVISCICHMPAMCLNVDLVVRLLVIISQSQ